LPRALGKYLPANKSKKRKNKMENTKIKRILVESGCTNSGCPNSDSSSEWHDTPYFPFGPKGDVLKTIGDRAVAECSNEHCHNNEVLEVTAECFVDNPDRAARIQQRVQEKLDDTGIEGLISLAQWFNVPTD
jgi:hypothetical protein